MKARVSQFFRKHFDIFDFLGLIGLIILGVGLWGFDQRISLIVVGAMMVFIGIKGAKASGPIK